MRILLFAVAVWSSPVLAENNFAVLTNGVTCYRTSTNSLFRDRSSACGGDTVFCTIPMTCYLPSGQYVGGSVATCRAMGDSGRRDYIASSAQPAAAAPTVGFTCPALQSCVDDLRQEFIREGEIFTSGNPSPAPSIFPLPGSSNQEEH